MFAIESACTQTIVKKDTLVTALKQKNVALKMTQIFYNKHRKSLCPALSTVAEWSK